MRLIPAVAVMLFAIGATPGAAQPIEVVPFRPALTQNRDAALCHGFLSAWTRVFDGTRELDESFLDLEAALPGAAVTTVPQERNARGKYIGFYDRVSAERFDLDGDGDDEVVHIESDDIGWRYVGVYLYVFDSAAEYAGANSGTAKRWFGDAALLAHPRPDASQELEPALHFGAANVLHFIALDHSVYTMSILPNLRRPRAGLAANVTLYRLDVQSRATPVCEADVLPPIEVFDDFTRDSAVFAALRSMYGGPEEGCLGSMGWTAPDPRSHLMEMFFRPQAMNDHFGEMIPASPGDDAAREVRLLVWGLGDPNSWDVYLSLKAGRAAFLRDMGDYYRQHFSASDGEARELAERVYRFLIDRIVYARNPDMHHLTRVALGAAALPITPDSTPGEVAAIAVRALLDQAANGFGKPTPVNPSRVWSEAALAAIFTRQDPKLVKQLMARYLAANASRLETDRAFPLSVANLEAEREAVLGTALIAAIGDSALTGIVLDLGADANARTNWFGKTPLMYAAQRDDVGAVRLLLERGADPSVATGESRDHHCHRPLQRNGRTPLMYAAENASPEVIRLLLEAGADAGARDTEANSPLWYLERNARLTEAARASVREWLVAAE